MSKAKEAKPKKEHLIDQVKKDKVAFAVYATLRILVIAVLVRSIFMRLWENVFVCVLSLILMLIPPIIEKKFKVEVPTALEIVAYVFVFSAEILGEIGAYYVKYPFWDTMLHTTNGFMFAAFGFCLVDILNRNKKFTFQLSPAFLAIVAFCFSMTVGVLWEFFEFFADYFLHTDMQKDYFIRSIHTVALNPDGANKAIHITDIISTELTTASGTVSFDGYLDVGIIDTTKDLLVNFIGAVVFSMIGFVYVKQRGRGRIASSFIPVLTDEAADAAQDPRDDSAQDGSHK